MSLTGQIGAVVFCAVSTAISINFLHERGGLEEIQDHAQTIVEEHRANSDAKPVATPSAPGRVTIAKARNGHFETEIRINGTDTDVLIDTGASLLALRESDARRAGIIAPQADYVHDLETASGGVRAARVHVRELQIGRVRIRDVEAFILPDYELGTNLLGMNVLSQFGKVTMAGDELVLDTRG